MPLVRWQRLHNRPTSKRRELPNLGPMRRLRAASPTELWYETGTRPTPMRREAAVSADLSMDPEIVNLYHEYHSLAGSPDAAAMLVLAQVQSGEQAPPPQSRAQPGGDYLSVKQAAERYNLGERTVYRMVEDGLSHVRAGRAIRIKPKDLDRWLADSETILR